MLAMPPEVITGAAPIFHTANASLFSLPLLTHGWLYSSSVDVEHWLQLHEQMPLVSRHLVSVELLQGVDTLSRDEGVEHVFVFELTTVHGLVGSFDLDRD